MCFAGAVRAVGDAGPGTPCGEGASAAPGGGSGVKRPGGGGVIKPGGWAGRAQGQPGFSSLDSWADNLECLSDGSWREEGVPSTQYSRSRDLGLHKPCVSAARRRWRVGTASLEQRRKRRSRAQPWEPLTVLFSSGSFCRIVLTLFSTLHMGKTEGVPYKYRGMCVTIFGVF